MKKKLSVAILAVGMGIASFTGLAWGNCDAERQVCMESGYGLTYCNNQWYRCNGF